VGLVDALSFAHLGAATLFAWQVARIISYRRLVPITSIRQVSERLNELLDRHDDELCRLDLIDVFCEVAQVREVLDAVQVELTGEAVKDRRILKVFAEQSGIPYRRVVGWARPFKTELAD